MANMKLALALACLIAVAGVASAESRRSLKLIYDQELLRCDLKVADYLALASNGGSSAAFGQIVVGTNAGSNELPGGDASKFILTTGPDGGGVTGQCARPLCIALGKFRGIQLQVADVPQPVFNRVAGRLLFNSIGPKGAYINAAPTYETPKEGPGIAATSGPIGRNNLILTSQDDDGTSFSITPANNMLPGPRDANLAVICGPQSNPFELPPDFCTKPDNPEFQGWAITTSSFTAANIVCPFGFKLGNVAANNLFASNPNLWNPYNPYDQTGFPLLQELIAKCAPGERVWVNTAPGFTSGNAAGSPPGSPGYCVTISEGFKGDPKGVDPKYTGGKPVPNDPKCLESHKALCFQSYSV